MGGVVSAKLGTEEHADESFRDVGEGYSDLAPKHAAARRSQHVLLVSNSDLRQALVWRAKPEVKKMKKMVQAGSTGEGEM